MTEIKYLIDALRQFNDNWTRYQIGEEKSPFDVSGIISKLEQIGDKLDGIGAELHQLNKKLEIPKDRNGGKLYQTPGECLKELAYMGLDISCLLEPNEPNSIIQAYGDETENGYHVAVNIAKCDDFTE